MERDNATVNHFCGVGDTAVSKAAIHFSGGLGVGKGLLLT